MQEDTFSTRDPGIVRDLYNLPPSVNELTLPTISLN